MEPDITDTSPIRLLVSIGVRRIQRPVDPGPDHPSQAAPAEGELLEDHLALAVRQVAAGKRYLSPGIAQAMALQGFNGDGSPFDSLSEREMQISMMVATCHKVQDIAERLNISAKTVNSYRYRVFEKLDVNGDVELTLLAIRHGLIDSPLN